MRNKENRTHFYSDIINDDFASTTINKKCVGKSYKYINRSLLWRAVTWFTYYIFAYPIVFTIAKLYLGVKIVNRGAVKEIRKTGFFLYGNHTRELDVFIPPLISFPTKAYPIANADAVSITGIRTLVKMLGCLPIPTERDALPNFVRAVEERASQKNCIVIYPEAHIWPFATFIRPFKPVSFRYPARLNMPIITATVTYRRRRGLFRFCKKPGITVYVSDPIYPDMSLSEHARRDALRNTAYEKMCEAAKNNTVEYIHYEKKVN